mgnify:CR=1 FL=1
MLFRSSLADAIDHISEKRSVFAAQLNQAGYQISNLKQSSGEYQSAVSAILDTDYASAIAQLSKGQILQQANLAMLAQANQHPSIAIRLLSDSFSNNYNLRNYIDHV